MIAIDAMDAVADIGSKYQELSIRFVPSAMIGIKAFDNSYRCYGFLKKINAKKTFPCINELKTPCHIKT